jgi:uncharacterized membrane protein YeaQ/YmgE (transglycosylase-associated protein family)
MDQPTLNLAAEQWTNLVLTWVGFGTLVGLVAKAVMPGRDPGGAVTTILMGIGGSVIGSALLNYFWQGRHVTPISPLGFAVATGGAFILLSFYRLFAGRWFVEPGTPRQVVGPRVHHRRTRRRAPVYEE